MEAIQKYPWGKGTPTWNRNATTNTSTRTYTVPTGKIWSLRYLYNEIVTTATVGNRVLIVQVGNGTNVVWVSRITGNIAASSRGAIEIRFKESAPLTSATPGNTVDLAAANSITQKIFDSAPEMIIPAGYTVRVWDYAAIDAAADDMITVIHYIEYDA